MTITVTLACAPAARSVYEETLVVSRDVTLHEAVSSSRIGAAFPGLDWRAMAPGIWGKAATWDRVLAHGDRVELRRPLLVDPKVARRERFRKQGARGTGLFARQRDGGKSGY